MIRPTCMSDHACDINFLPGTGLLNLDYFGLHGNLMIKPRLRNHNYGMQRWEVPSDQANARDMPVIRDHGHIFMAEESNLYL